MRWLRKVRATGGIAAAQLRRNPLRTGFAVVGLALAVLSVTLLASVGVGVLDTGQERFDSADRDLWISAGQTRLTPAGGGGFTNSITDSRNLTEEIKSTEGVRSAAPLAFESVYVDTDDGDFESVLAIGVPAAGGSSVSITKGKALQPARGNDPANTTGDVLLDRRTAAQLNASIGDRVRVGGTIASARENEFTVVGQSSTFTEFLGAPTITLTLDEFYHTTGTTRTEPATFITVRTEEGADVTAVAKRLREQYPGLDVRTNDQQLRAVLQTRLVVITAGAVLVGIGIIAGIALAANVLALLAHQQRRPFAALTAQGCSRSTIALTVAWQGFLLGCAGALLGVGLTYPAAMGLNAAAAALVGFEGLVVVESWIPVTGVAIAIVAGTLSATIAGHRVVRTRPLDALA
jgi:putative ABC transport system permease protein